MSAAEMFPLALLSAFIEVQYVKREQRRRYRLERNHHARLDERKKKMDRLRTKAGLDGPRKPRWRIVRDIW